MALSNMRQWDQYEHPMPEHMEQERVLNAIDRLFEESDLFNPMTRDKFPDLVERSTAGVRESVQQALDPHMNERIDRPGDIPAPIDKSMAQQILEKTEQEKRAEAFGSGLKGWFRKHILKRPLREAEVMLSPEDRGIRAFTQRQVLGATYFLDPERAERLTLEGANAAVGTPEHDRYLQFNAENTGIKAILSRRLGREIWAERQAYPPIRFAMSFIANMHLTMPIGFDIGNFVREAIRRPSTTYQDALNAANQARNEFSGCESINRINTLLGELEQATKDLNTKCPGNYAEAVAPYTRPPGRTAPGALPAGTSRSNLEFLMDEESLAMIEAMRMMEPTPGTPATPATATTPFVPATPPIPPSPAAVAECMSIYKAAKERRRGLATQLQQIREAKLVIDSKKTELLAVVRSLQSSPERDAFINEIDRIIPTAGNVIASDDVTDVKNRLMSGAIKNAFNAVLPPSAGTPATTRSFSVVLQERLDQLKHTKEIREKELTKSQETRETKLTPEELVYKLFHYYFTHRQNQGGFLENDPNILPDYWISDQNTPFMNKLRDRALLATRFAISEAKDQAVFAQLYANRGLAQHALAQRTRWGRFMEWGRSGRLGNKIATAFGRPEQVTFDKILERIRTVEVTRNNKTERPFTELELKKIVTRGDLRKAIHDKELKTEDLPLLASYLEVMLKESSKIEIRPADAEMVYRTIRNLRLVRQEILHKQFMEEAARKPGSMPEKLKEFWKTKWAAEEELDRQMTDEAMKREFVKALEKKKFSADKKKIVGDIINDLKAGTIGIHEATARLHQSGYKLGRLTGLGLWSRVRALETKDAAVKGAKAAGAAIAAKLPEGTTIKKAALAIPKWTIYKPAKFVAWDTPKFALWTAPKGVLKYAWRHVKQAGTDMKSVFGTAITGGGAPGAKPAASH